jgi:hypothetical protein
MAPPATSTAPLPTATLSSYSSGPTSRGPIVSLGARRRGEISIEPTNTSTPRVRPTDLLRRFRDAKTLNSFGTRRHRTTNEQIPVWLLIIEPSHTLAIAPCSGMERHMTSVIYEIAAYASRVLSGIWQMFLDGSAIYGVCMAVLPPCEEQCSDAAKRN